MIKRKKNKEIFLLVAITVILAAIIVSVAILAKDEEEVPVEIHITMLSSPATPIAKPTPTPEEIIITPVPTATPVPQIPMHILEYRNENEDTVGYISIEGTVVDYPVMYSGDNEFYLQKDFNKNYSYYGAIFLDYRCDVYDMASTRNIILYGHRMRDGSMFRSLVFYFEKGFFDDHRIIAFDTLAGEMKWEVFAVYEAHIDFYYINTDFSNDIQWLKFIKYCQRLSEHETDVELELDDIVLTLSTCSTDKNHRVVVMAKLID